MPKLTLTQRSLPALLCLSLLTPPIAALAAPVKEPPHDAIPAGVSERVMASGLMTGYPDGKFHAEAYINRAELAAIMTKTFDIDKRRPRSPLEDELRDVSPKHWAYEPIQTVLRNGIMIGYRPGYFYPNQKMTRAEAYAIFAQAYGVFQFKDEEVNAILSEYADADKIPVWARKAWATALHEGFVNVRHGESGNLIRPGDFMTRGDLAYALSHYLDRQQKLPASVAQ